MEKSKMDIGLDSFETIIENILGGIGMFEIDKNGKIKVLYLNNGFYRMIGYSRPEAERYLKNVMANIIVEDRQTLEQGIADVLKDDGWVEVEFRAVTKDGGVRWYQVRANLYALYEDRSIIMAILLDATERKSMDEELALQAERMNLISQVEGEHIFDYNAKTDILVIKAVHRETRVQDIILNDFFQKKHYENIFEDDRVIADEVFQKALKSSCRDTAEIRVRIGDGDYQWYRLVFSSILGNEGYVTRVVGRLTNIHDNNGSIIFFVGLPPRNVLICYATLDRMEKQCCSFSTDGEELKNNLSFLRRSTQCSIVFPSHQGQVPLGWLVYTSGSVA